MSGLWTNDRDTLAKAMFTEYTGGKESWAKKNQRGRSRWLVQVDRLIDQGAVRVLDPDDPVQRGRVAKRLREIEVQAVAGIHRDDTDWAAGELIKALRQP
jgi:hypothetical protein